MPNSRKNVAVTRWPQGDVHVQFNGKDIGIKSVRELVLDDMEQNSSHMIRIDRLDVYVKPSDNRAYYAANGPTGPVSGSVEL